MPALQIPDHLLNIPYNGQHYPSAVALTLSDGANCQVFAYELLKFHGLELPPLRSSDLWEDHLFTIEVQDFVPLDLLLFHSNPDAYGAHVAVFVGNDSVIHLARHNGWPRIERVVDLMVQDRYRFLVGGKRARNR